MEEHDVQADPVPLNNTDLAYERTIVAEERTLMAWIRTAVALISFGFTIYKFFQEISTKPRHHTFMSSRHIGMIMIGMGMLGLMLATLDHIKARRRLRLYYKVPRRSVATLMAVLIWMFGLMLFLAVFYRD